MPVSHATPTSGVVLSTACAAADEVFVVTVLSNACADPDLAMHEVLMKAMRIRCRDVTSVEDWKRKYDIE